MSFALHDPKEGPSLNAESIGKKGSRAVGIPLPEIYHTGAVNNHLWSVYERLPGTDLEDAYPSLSTLGKRDIAHAVAKIQQKVHLLDKHHFQRIYPWVDVIHTIVKRSEREILAVGLSKKKHVARVSEKIQDLLDYLHTVKPVPFLYDLNVRNVIVKGGEVTGIIDVDALWFGDPLLAIGRGKTILLTMQQDTDFISRWCQFLNLSDLQLKMVDFYALLYSVRFMGTIGQNLNGSYSLQADPNIAHLLDKVELLTHESLDWLQNLAGITAVLAQYRQVYFPGSSEFPGK